MANLDPRQRKPSCEACNAYCTSASNLFDHLMGRRHRDNTSHESLECRPYEDSLQYIFDTYMKLEPLVGLEYVTQRMKRDFYFYQCLLCGFKGRKRPAFLHITGLDHITKYLKNHHPEFCVVRESYNQNREFLRALQQAAVKVCEMSGRKTIVEVNADGSPCPTSQNMSKSSSDSKTENVTPDLNRDCNTSSLQHLEQKGSDQPAASDVCKRFGRKRITEVNADGSHGPTPPKMSKSSSDSKTESNVTPDINRDSHTGSLQNLERKGSDHPAASDVCEKFGSKNVKEINGLPQKMLESDSDPKTENNVTPDIIGDVHTRSLQNLEQKGSDHPAEVLGFTRNREFLDFLQKFEIRSKEDAWIIKKIIQNCAQALVRFQEEQPQQNQVSGGPQAPANETGKGSSVSATGTGKVAPAPELQTYGLELFFNSIKNMEGSEVGIILQEIAATNPAFRGIDVTNVIKYLQATGRLKTS